MRRKYQRFQTAKARFRSLPLVLRFKVGNRPASRRGRLRWRRRTNLRRTGHPVQGQTRSLVRVLPLTTDTDPGDLHGGSAWPSSIYCWQPLPQ